MIPGGPEASQSLVTGSEEDASVHCADGAGTLVTGKPPVALALPADRTRPSLPPASGSPYGPKV